VGKKAQFAIRKAAIPAGIAVAAIGAAAKSALKAGEQVNSANARIRQINKTMGLFGKETDIVNTRIIKLAESQGRLTGVSNIQIKEQQAQLLSFKNLARTADTVGGSFDRASKAVLDMQASNVAGGNAALQLGKALEDPIKNIDALKRAGIQFTEEEKAKIAALVESNQLFEAQDIILDAVEKKFGGVAEATADDSKKVTEAFEQFRQSLGLSLLPVLEDVTPRLVEMADWARENPEKFRNAAAAIGAIAVSVLALNAAMKASIFFKAAGALGPLSVIVAAFGAAYVAIESFQLGVNAQFNKWAGYLEKTVNAGVKALNPFIGLINKLIPGGDPLAKLGLISIPRLNTTPKSQQGAGFAALDQIPRMADGGIIKASPGGTLALIGEGGRDEAVIPLDRAGGMGGINITVHAGLVSSPDQVGQQIIEAIQKAQRRSGPVFAPA
jgi:hypothetical protein